MSRRCRAGVSQCPSCGSRARRYYAPWGDDEEPEEDGGEEGGGLPGDFGRRLVPNVTASLGTNHLLLHDCIQV